MSQEPNDDDYGEEGFEDLSDEEGPEGPTSTGSSRLPGAPETEQHGYKSSRADLDQDSQYRELMEHVQALQRQRRPEEEVRVLRQAPGGQQRQQHDDGASSEEDVAPRAGAGRRASYATEAHVWDGGVQRADDDDEDYDDDDDDDDDHILPYVGRNSRMPVGAERGSRSRQPVVRHGQAHKGRSARSATDDSAQLAAAVARMPPAGGLMEHAVSGHHHAVHHHHLHPNQQQHHMMLPSHPTSSSSNNSNNSNNNQPGNNKGGGKSNLTFSFEQLQEMERENERLLGSMIRIHRRGSTGTFSVNQQYMRAGRQPSSSLINRQKQAREIQRANQMMAMRLESVRATVKNKNPSKQTWRAPKAPARPATLVQPEWQS